jgi:hypothetical protein
MAYTDSATVKSYLGNVPSGASVDALITGFVAAAQSMIDGYCHQPFEAAADTTRYFDPLRDTGRDGSGVAWGNPYSYNGSRTLFLDAPLCAVTTITNGDGVVVAPTAYVTEPRNSTPWFSLTLKSSSGLSWQSLEIAIVGKWAYSVVAPPDIVQTATRLAAYLYRQRDNGFDLDRIIQTQSGVVMPLDIPRDIAKLLEPYKRIVV